MKPDIRIRDLLNLPSTETKKTFNEDEAFIKSVCDMAMGAGIDHCEIVFSRGKFHSYKAIFDRNH